MEEVYREIVEADDHGLEPEIVRWLTAYATATEVDRDATVAELLAWMNGHLHRSEAERTATAAQSEARLRVLTEQMPAILWSTDADLRVTLSIGGGLVNVGAMPALYADRRLVDLLGTDDPESPPLIAHRRALQGERAVYEYEWKGRTFTVHIEPLRDATGAVVGLVGAALDVTEGRQALEALARREAQLAEAQQLAHLGSWERDLTTDVETWSDEYYRIYGLEPRALPATYQHFIERVHPDDVDRVRAMAEVVASTGEPYAIDFRIVRPNGDVRLVHNRGAFLKDAAGRPVRLLGTVQDVTESKQAVEALRQSEERFRVALQGTPTVVFSQDSELRLTWIYNPILGFTSESIIGKTDEDLHTPENASILTALKRRVLETGTRIRQEVRLTLDGEDGYYDYTIEPMRDPAGEIIGITGTATDITERKRAENERALQRERQARLDGMLFAARKLASQATTGLTASSGAIDRLRPDGVVPPQLRDALEAVATGLSAAMGAIDELQRLIPPVAPADAGVPAPADGQSSPRA